MSLFASNGAILQDQSFGATEVSNLDEGKGAWGDDAVVYSSSVTLDARAQGKTIYLADGTTATLPATPPKGWSVTIGNGSGGGGFLVTAASPATISGAAMSSGALTVAVNAQTTLTVQTAGAYANRISLVSDGTNYIITSCSTYGNVTTA